MNVLRCAVFLIAFFVSGSGFAQDAVRDAAALAAEADRYAEGYEVVQSDAEALRLYREAAELGDAYAMHRLGEIYAAGRGVAASDEVAVTYFRAAMALAYAPAVTSLGICYAEGKGVAFDPRTARALLERAAASGDGRARDYLARHRLKP